MEEHIGTLPMSTIKALLEEILPVEINFCVLKGAYIYRSNDAPKDGSQMDAAPIVPNHLSLLPTHEIDGAFRERSKPPHLVTHPQSQESEALPYDGAGLRPSEAYS
ncbi:hypothetical protein L484_026692 [Morus notabilis]|uniref:Uncharacterized protein n=1 Tax=Morus notabilis TaxID=981085 RepID=W9SN13_9ROSA|nr:hypothetical protein L484_026692 [Morus notabilis]